MVCCSLNRQPVPPSISETTNLGFIVARRYHYVKILGLPSTYRRSSTILESDQKPMAHPSLRGSLPAVKMPVSGSRTII